MWQTIKISQGSCIDLTVKEAIDISLEFSNEVEAEASVTYNEEGEALFSVDVVNDSSKALILSVYTVAAIFSMNVEEVQ